LRTQIGASEHHADLAAHLVDLFQIVGELDAIDDDLTLLMLFQAVDAADHRRLAGTRGPADDDTLTLHHLEVDIPENVVLPVPLVHLLDIDSDIRRGHLHPHGVRVKIVGTYDVFARHSSILLHCYATPQRRRD
jgi:hypothetical protein